MWVSGAVEFGSAGASTHRFKQDQGKSEAGPACRKAPAGRELFAEHDRCTPLKTEDISGEPVSGSAVISALPSIGEGENEDEQGFPGTSEPQPGPSVFRSREHCPHRAFPSFQCSRSEASTSCSGQRHP